MKKSLSLILSLIMIISVFAPMNSVIASAAEQHELDKAAENLADMLRDDDDFKDKLLSDDVSSVTVNDRIIIKTDEKNINTFNSTSTASIYGYTVVQYSDIKSAAYAYSEFQKLGYEPVYDTISTVNDYEDDEEIVSSASLDDTYSYSVYRDEKYEWGYDMCDIDETVSYYNRRLSREIVVAVMDSGIQYNINVFKNRVIRTEADFSYENSGDEMDTFGHGTQVASTVAMCTPDSVKIEGFRVSVDNIVADSSVIMALNYIKEMNKKPDIVNMSFSGTTMDSHIENEINELTDMGIVFVGSAGNNGEEMHSYPASYDNVIAVAGVDKNVRPCDFSNYGNHVDIAAPGKFTTYKAIKGNSVPSYVYSSGTSFSAPIVASAAALVLAVHRNYSPADVKQRLLDTCIPFKEKDCLKQYGKGIVNFANLVEYTKCKAVTASHQSGVHQKPFELCLDCQNTLVDIVYTTDGTLPTLKNGTVYTEPIEISSNTRIIAAAYERTGSVFHGDFFCADYYFGSSDYVIDSNGTIKAYIGSNSDVAVPENICGVTPVSVGENCFRYSNINSISLPVSVTNIDDYAFSDCSATSIDSSNISTVGEYAFAGSDFNSVVLENVKAVSDFAFLSSNAQTVKLGDVTEIANGMFKNCAKLETVYCPKLVDCKTNAEDAFENCKSLKTLFAPKARSMYLDIPSNVNLYVSNRLSLDYSAVGDYIYTFIAQLESGVNILRDYIEKNTPNRFSFKDSGGYANAKGAQIRTTDSGLRFGFDWIKMTDLENLADNVEYGFVVSYKDTDTLDVDNADKKVKAAKIAQNGDRTDFNLVIKNIPSDKRDIVFSVRAYVNIDGLYFYSPIAKRSFNQVAIAVASDDEIDDQVRESAKELIKEVRI